VSPVHVSSVAPAGVRKPVYVFVEVSKFFVLIAHMEIDWFANQLVRLNAGFIRDYFQVKYEESG
jgi:hypothetical protein